MAASLVIPAASSLLKGIFGKQVKRAGRGVNNNNVNNNNNNNNSNNNNNNTNLD